MSSHDYSGSHYEAVAAGLSDWRLGQRGCAGDYLDRLIVVVATADATAAVSVKDGNSAAISVFPGTPGRGVGRYMVKIGAMSKKGAWKVTTGAGSSVIAVGDFSSRFGRYLSLPGSTGNHGSSPDSAAASIIGDIDIRARIAADDWTPAALSTVLSKYTETGNQRSYALSIKSDGTIQLRWSADGTAVITKPSTAAPTIADGAVLWIRATLDVDNGAAGNDVKFYTSPTGKIWTQLGTTVTTATATAISDTTAVLVLSGINAGTAEFFAGKVFYAEIRTGLNGALAATFDADDAGRAGVTSFSSTDTSEVWTVNGTAAIV